MTDAVRAYWEEKDRLKNSIAEPSSSLADAAIAALEEEIDGLSAGYEAANEAALAITAEWKARAGKAEADVKFYGAANGELKDKLDRAREYARIEIGRKNDAIEREGEALDRAEKAEERERITAHKLEMMTEQWKRADGMLDEAWRRSGEAWNWPKDEWLAALAARWKENQ